MKTIKSIVLTAIAIALAFLLGSQPAQAGMLGNLTKVYGDMVTGKQTPFQLTYTDPGYQAGVKANITIQDGEASIGYAGAQEIGPVGAYAQEQAKLAIGDGQISYHDKVAFGIRIGDTTAYIRAESKIEAGVIHN